MSRTPKAASAEAREASAVAVYDFFYYDAARIGSYIGQIDDSGHLQSVKQADHLSRSRKPGYTLKASASISSAVPGTDAPEAGISYSRHPQESASQANERTYDPMWINACNFIDFLEEEGALVSDLGQAAMGQFVDLSGRLSVVDAQALQVLWSNSDIQKRWIRNSETQKATAGVIGGVDKKAGETVLGNTRLVFDLLARMPHGIHCVIKSGEFEAWGPLRTEGMVSPVGDVTLIHGGQVSGEWRMIGIMDARPNTQEELDEFISPVTEVPVHGLHRALSGLANMARKALGRPAGAYGVTPLLIFRNVKGL